jgi:hypothetical protein
MAKVYVILLTFICFVLCGCAATGKPMTWKEEDIQFSKYKSFEIRPVENKTGQSFEEDIPSKLTELLKAQFKEEGLNIPNEASDPSEVLIVESDLMLYVLGSAFKRWLAPGAGKTQCTLKSRLLDKLTNQLVAETVAAKEVGAGGLYSVGAEEWILEEAASEIASETSKLVFETEAN